MNLDDIVPPLELCKKIPAGEFEDTAFQWEEVTIKGKLCVDIIQHYPFEWENPEWAILYPAPTWQEIMTELPASNIYRIKQTWTANFINDSVSNGIKSRSATTAALKLWLKLKGIEDGK